MQSRDTKKIIDGIGYVDSLKDMNLIIEAINKRNRYLRTMATKQAKRIYSEGDAVFIRTREGLEEATIHQIRRTRAVVRLDDGLLYSVRLNQIERKL